MHTHSGGPLFRAQIQNSEGITHAQVSSVLMVFGCMHACPHVVEDDGISTSCYTRRERWSARIGRKGAVTSLTNGDSGLQSTQHALKPRQGERWLLHGSASRPEHIPAAVYPFWQQSSHCSPIFVRFFGFVGQKEAKTTVPEGKFSKARGQGTRSAKNR